MDSMGKIDNEQGRIDKALLGLRQAELAQKSPKKKSQRQRILEMIRAAPLGLICDEVEVIGNIPHQSAGPRMGDLYRLGLITYTGETRKTRTGSRADIAYAVPMDVYHPDAWTPPPDKK